MSGWPSAPLGDVVEILDNLRKPITKNVRQAGQIPYYGATGIVDFVDGFIFDETLVLVGEDGAKWESGANSAFKICGKTWVNNHAHVLRPHREKVLDEWLIFYLNYEDLLPFVSGLTVPKLNQGSLRSIEIPLPPLKEQKRIVALLDATFAKIAAAEEKQKAVARNAVELFNSISNNRLTGNPDAPMVPLGDICDFVGGGTPPKDRQDFYDGKIPWATVRDLSREHLISTEHSITPEGLSASSSNVIPSGSVVIASRVGLGKVCILGQHTAINQDLRGVVPKTTTKIENRFLFRWFQSVAGVIIDAGRGATVQGVTLPFLKSLEVPLPPLEEQKRIVALLDMAKEQSDKIAANAARALACQAEVKASVLRRAFEGAL